MDSSHDDEQDDIPPSSSENTIENEEMVDMKDEKWDTFQKSTFKSALQAKKRLQAFGQQKQLLISPSMKSRTTSISEKSPNEQSESQEVVSPTKFKKENPIDKAKATIEEIELLKRSEFGFLPVTNEERKMMRSRSKSSDGDFIFRKRERKIRNYRRSDNARRSPSPMITTARNKHTDKPKNKYPKNWEEFVKDNWTYEKLASKESHIKSKTSNTSNDIFRHLLFDSPAEIIKPYHFKNDRGDDIKVPFKYLRYTLSKPKVAFNENMFKVKERFLSRKQVLDRTSKENKTILEKFYNRTTKRFKTSEPLGQRNWYLKNWRDSDSKIQETSIGLSFLQTYSDDDEEEEQILADSISELNETKRTNIIKVESRDEGKYEKFLMDYERDEFNLSVDPKMEDSVIKEDRKERDQREIKSPDKQKNRTTENTNRKVKREENMSWTPEKKVFTSEDTWQESPKVKNELITPEEKNSEKTESKIPSDDEWAETPERKSQETDKEKKKKKKNKEKSNSDSPSSSKKLRKKKKKLDKKKKQREKEKKARKKEKLKAEKLKKEKKKEKEKEKEKKKEILKKLKKELRKEEKKKKTQSVENLLELPVKVKIEKEEVEESVVEPVEDLRDFLNQKEKDHHENVEKVDDTTVPKNDHIVELFSVNVKQEKISDDKRRKKEEKPEEIIKDYKKVEETLKCHKEDEETLRDPKEIEETSKVNKKEEDKELILDLESKPVEKVKSVKKNKKEDQEIIGRVTPDTEEYQSNWESDDGISPIVKLGSKRSSRGWESDEEVFERAFAKKEKTDVPFRESPILEMPLDIKKFPRRNFNRPEKKRSRTRSPEYLDMDEEIKRLEAERINLSKQRMQLEMEKIRIHELEREKSMEEMARMPEEDQASEWPEKQQNRNRDKRHTKDESIDSTSRDRREKLAHSSKNKDKVTETSSTSIDSNKSRSGSILSIHSSPEITSTKSPNRTGLENAYQEFMRAVSGSGGTETKDIVISSTDSEPQIVETSNRSKVRYSKSRRDRKRGRSVDKVEEKQEQKVLSTTDPKILQEILLPGEIPLPDIPIPFPVPVPSPKLDLSQNVLSTGGGSSVQAISLQSPAAGNQSAQESVDNQQFSSDNSTPMRPFSFSTLVISSKKPALLEKTRWKVDEDSDEEPKKKLEEMIPEESFKDQNEEINEENKKSNEKKEPEPKVEVKVSERRDKEKKEETDNKREQGKSAKRKLSRSRSPLDTSRDKRRKEDDTRRREDDTRRRENDTKRREEESRRREEAKRREEVRRRESGGKRAEEVVRREGEDAKRRDRNRRPSPPKHRETSPRRRRLSSPIHRRSSPRQRSPGRRTDPSRKPEITDRRSPQRSSAAKRRRSYSPAKPSPAPRRRSPGHYDRISKSPRRSPMEGLKRSVADSTISDDLLPQPYTTESSNSPLCSSTPAPSSRKSRFNLSPKRPSLDERINQVLGIESQQQAQQTVWKPPSENCQVDPRQSAAYPGYLHHNVTADLGHASTPPATSSKVLQVGNIIQVVPSEDFGALPPQPVQAPAVQKIVQVGNMLQIVPSDMEPMITPQLPPIPPIETAVTMEKSVVVSSIPERRSAEDVLVGRMAERDRKKQEKEDRKREKERKRKEKDKKKKMRLKVSTEEMIKRALELDGYIGTDGEDQSSLVPEVINDTPGLDPSRSILSTSTSRFSESTVKTERERKSVQFADGVRPGEGTSPSGGEELASPPPQSDVLVKPKKYKRSGSVKKKKRKVKVKVVKKRHIPIPPPPATDSDEEFENLPPPSPPPGSPPPHVFPVRAKVHTINNIPQHYLPSYGITTAPQTPPVVQPQPRMSLAFQTPPTAMYRTPPPNVVGQHYSRMSHAPPMGMNVPPPPPPTSIHRDQQPYGSF